MICWNAIAEVTHDAMMIGASGLLITCGPVYGIEVIVELGSCGVVVCEFMGGHLG